MRGFLRCIVDPRHLKGFITHESATPGCLNAKDNLSFITKHLSNQLAVLDTAQNTVKMVIKLYGSAMSTARVLVTILEKELPYELIFIDISKGDQRNKEYLKMQPFGKVPVMDDDGFVMFESRAICRYLARLVDHRACRQSVSRVSLDRLIMYQ